MVLNCLLFKYISLSVWIVIMLEVVIQNIHKNCPSNFFLNFSEFMSYVIIGERFLYKIKVVF